MTKGQYWCLSSWDSLLAHWTMHSTGAAMPCIEWTARRIQTAHLGAVVSSWILVMSCDGKLHQSLEGGSSSTCPALTSLMLILFYSERLCWASFPNDWPDFRPRDALDHGLQTITRSSCSMSSAVERSIALHMQWRCGWISSLHRQLFCSVAESRSVTPVVDVSNVGVTILSDLFMLNPSQFRVTESKKVCVTRS